MKIVIKCYNCGEELSVKTNKEPQFTYELVAIANASGWYGVFDVENSRSLIFCCEKCIDAQRKKDGSFKLRPKKKGE